MTRFTVYNSGLELPITKEIKQKRPHIVNTHQKSSKMLMIELINFNEIKANIGHGVNSVVQTK